MKYFIILICSFLFLSCANVEQRIKEYSYTEDFYFDSNGQRYQVYKTKKGNKYILVLNKKETNFKRKYL